MSSSGLRKHRCRNHLDREAVARCPVCQEHFCRECITEHDGRLLCANCQADQIVDRKSGKTIVDRLVLLLLLGVGCFTAWLLFYAIGRALAGMPQHYHSVTL